MNALEALTWYVAVPAVLCAVIAIAVYAPAWIRSPKYRPGLSWWADPVWFGGGALSDASSTTAVREGGGCSASW
jgi:hypothetical protein